MKITAKTEVNISALAAILGITGRRVHQLAQDGVITAQSRGVYLLGDSVKAYAEYRAREPAMNDAEIEKHAAEISIKKANAIILEMEAKELQKNMHCAEDVAAMTDDMIYTIEEAVQDLPGRLGADVAAAGTASEAAEIIRKEVHSVMLKLSKYRFNPQKYEERVRERQNWEPRERGDSEDEDDS